MTREHDPLGIQEILSIVAAVAYEIDGSLAVLDQMLIATQAIMGQRSDATAVANRLVCRWLAEAGIGAGDGNRTHIGGAFKDLTQQPFFSAAQAACDLRVNSLPSRDWAHTTAAPNEADLPAAPGTPMGSAPCCHPLMGTHDGPHRLTVPQDRRWNVPMFNQSTRA